MASTAATVGIGAAVTAVGLWAIGTFSKPRRNPFAGYSDFSACMKDQRRKGARSPGGVCNVIERRSRAKHRKKRRRAK